MKKQNLLKGTLIAASVAGLFACEQSKSNDDSKAAASKPTDEVHCEGINTCTGKSLCHMSDGSHACAGQNTCKGKGWIKVSPEECTAKNGKIVAAK